MGNNNNKITATQLPDEVGILPHHYVRQDIDAYLAKVDAVKQFAIDLMEKEP